MKARRQRKIIELITNQDVETQEDLARLLMENGYHVTQATVSRDIRELNLTKIATASGRQKYTLPNTGAVVLRSKFQRVFNDAILTVTTSGNIIVIKTVAGMAMPVAAAVDAMEVKEILGCIAGDDTVMCVIDDAAHSEQVREYLEEFAQ